MLETVAERFNRLQNEIRMAQLRAQRAEEYAESSARLHHAAICRLHHMLTGSYAWPAESDRPLDT